MAESTTVVATGFPFLHLAQLNKFCDAVGLAAASSQIYNDACPVPDDTIRLLALSAIAEQDIHGPEVDNILMLATSATSILAAEHPHIRNWALVSVVARVCFRTTALAPPDFGHLQFAACAAIGDIRETLSLMIKRCLTESQACRVVEPAVMTQLHQAAQRYLNAVARMPQNRAANFIPHPQKAMALALRLHQQHDGVATQQTIDLAAHCLHALLNPPEHCLMARPRNVEQLARRLGKS